MLELGVRVIIQKWVGGHPPGAGATLIDVETGAFPELMIHSCHIRLDSGRQAWVNPEDIVPVGEEELCTCLICGYEIKYSQFDHKKDMCVECIEDGASEEMERWLQQDYNDRCTL